jgi:hypothetical protein
VLRGEAGESILDTYQPEREPHVRFITEKAIELGRVQTLRDPAAARERDERLLAQRRAHREPEKLRYPNLTGGLLATGDAGRHAGEFFVQGHVRSASVTARFDDVIGPGLCVVARARQILDALSVEESARFQRLGGHLVALAADARADGAIVEVVDVEGIYTAWFDGHGCDAVVVRPDWYVYGTAAQSAGLGVVLSELHETVGAHPAHDRVG